VKDIFLIRTWTGKDGKENADWIRAGVAFNENKDGSMNFELYTMPNCRFQIREKKEKNADQKEF
jgi:hypothetical protein